MAIFLPVQAFEYLGSIRLHPEIIATLHPLPGEDLPEDVIFVASLANRVRNQF
jgi:hypothetical protein